MKQYQVIYCKAQPLSCWCETAEEATAKAEMFEKVGYSVTIWEHTEEGAVPYNKTLLECFGITDEGI